jgi:hypothetical protein
MKTAADYLDAAIKELEASRDDIDRQIRILRRTHTELTGESVPDRPPSDGDDGPSPSSGDASGRPVRDIAIEVAQRGEVFSLAEVVDAARAEGNQSKYASISSILSRLAKEGVLTAGPRRGSYQLRVTTGEAMPQGGVAGEMHDGNRDPLNGGGAGTQQV